MAAKKKAADAPDFPKLKKNEFFWEGTSKLPAWAGYQDRSGSYGSPGSHRASTGKVLVSVTIPEDKKSPSPQQIAAFAHVQKSQEKLRDAMLTRLFKEYPQLQKEFGYSDEEAEELMPNIKSKDDFKNLIGLHTLHVLNVAHRGKAYIGFEFGCSWDMEHGLGCMTHGSRIVEMGGADSSFMECIAESDAESR